MTLPTDWKIPFNESTFNGKPAEALRKAFYNLEEMHAAIRKEIPTYADVGDLIIGTEGSLHEVLPKGADGKVLTAGTTTISWEDTSGETINIGGTLYTLSVDANGFVKATVL